MSDIPLAHLSRQQLVQLLLRVVDLLAQPVLPSVQTVAPVQTTTGSPVLEPYDASLDPWNAPDACPTAGAGSREGTACGALVGSAGPPLHQLNPGACALYPVVSGCTAPSCAQLGSNCASCLQRCFGVWAHAFWSAGAELPRVVVCHPNHVRLVTLHCPVVPLEYMLRWVPLRVCAVSRVGWVGGIFALKLQWTMEV